MMSNLILNSFESFKAYEHVATKIHVFFFESSKHLVGKILICLYFVEFKNTCNFNNIFFTSYILRIMLGIGDKGPARLP
jgi:hypothetical protein